jgi:RNA polymerase sigma factor (sigma-70 family)
MTSQFHTSQLHKWIDGLRGGDRAAQDQLFRAVGDRLERLARKMLRDYPRVKRWTDTGDVLQNASLRLLRALQEVHPASTREFFSLAAELIRRELLDLARHFYSSKGMGNQRSSPALVDNSSAPADPAADTDEREVDKWCAFHEQVARLPAEEREVVGLIFYHGWTQAEVADFFQVTERTIRRRWQAALLKLHDVLQDEQGDRRDPG